MAPLRCPFSCLGCSFTSTQLQRLVDHVNTHRKDIDDGGLLWVELITQAKLNAHWCACGLLFPDTQHGRAKHLDVCESASAEVAADMRQRRDTGNDSAFSGALAGLTTQSLGAVMSGSDVTIGTLQLTARDCGSLAGSHSNVCFYMSCADGNTTDALALKQRLARLATALATAGTRSTRIASQISAR